MHLSIENMILGKWLFLLIRHCGISYCKHIPVHFKCGTYINSDSINKRHMEHAWIKTVYYRTGTGKHSSGEKILIAVCTSSLVQNVQKVLKGWRTASITKKIAVCVNAKRKIVAWSSIINCSLRNTWNVTNQKKHVMYVSKPSPQNNLWQGTKAYTTKTWSSNANVATDTIPLKATWRDTKRRVFYNIYIVELM